MKIDFKCNQNENENIPKDIVENLKLKFPILHTRAKDISIVSKKLKIYKNDSICKVPFCTTVEAESFGGLINLGDDKNTPRVKEYAYNNVDELSKIDKIDFDNGRIKEVLESIRILKNDEIVSLNICGPITILSLLIDLKYFYKSIRKKDNVIVDIMKVLEDNIVNYAIRGYRCGAKIISYSDPVGDINIVGPKVYKEVVFNSTLNIIKRILNETDDIVIHLCGKTSSSLYNLDVCEFNEIRYDNNLTYGEAICNLLDDKCVKLIGNNCMKRTPHKLKNSIIYSIEIK
ncbi:uroporphyrinogen decarboxylase family protein [Paraclostridium sordellii]|uniref:uroporphyrinogen decarboxylase family protein n=1 Tax=Paraclostridium sordellii TaxID=1505 RepID=UPI0005DCE6B8|nr:uroporphyrinogen decarboxylase family protein [Paeniclostridium sordellii]CEP81293.1 uroporphyrinogen decarboxylase HemE [[Clostridium] sordellii] [Paeniclostridium sordellii]